MIHLLFCLIAARPEVVVQVGPGEQLQDAALSADGKYAATVGQDVAVKLWDAERGLLLRLLVGVGSVVSGVTFSPDRKHLVAWSLGHQVVFDLLTGQVVGQGYAQTKRFAFTPDGSKVAYGNGTSIVVAQMPSLKPIYELKGSFSDPILSADGKELAAYEFTGTRKVMWWNTADGKPRGQVVPPIEGSAVHYTASGEFMVVAHDQMKGVTHAGKELWATGYARVTAARDWQTMLICDKAAGTFLFDSNTGVRRDALWTKGRGCFNQMALSGDGKTWIQAENQSVYIGPVRAGIVPLQLKREGSTVQDATVSPNGKQLASANEDGSVRVWDLRTGQLRESVNASRAAISSVRFTDDGTLLLAGTDEGEVIALQLDPLREHARVKPCSAPIRLSHAKGTAFISCSATREDPASTLFAWQPAPGASARKIAHHTDIVHDFTASPTGDVLFLRTYTHAQAMRTSDGVVTWSIELGFGSSIGRSRDGSKLVSVQPGVGVVTIDATSGALTHKCKYGRESMQVVSFAQNDTRILSTGAGPSYDVYVADAATCAIETQLQGHRTIAVAAGWAADGKLLMSASRTDLTIRLWNRATNREAAQLLAVAGGGYVAVTPDGYYASSKDATRAITFTLGLRAYGYDLFDLRLNRPDILVERLGLGDKALIDVYRAAADKRLAKAGFKRDSFGDAFAVPEISVKEGPGDNRALELEAKSADSSAPLDRLQVSVNGVPLSSRGTSLGRAKSATTKVRVPLGAGVNSIQLSAVNVAGIESERVTLTRTVGGVAKGKLHVIAIGVSKYQQAEYDLDYAAKDANDVAAFLATESARFDGVSSKVVTNAEVTRERVRALKNELLTTSVDDTVILFVAGHGLLDGKLDYYFATHDVAFDKPAERGLAWSDLEALFDGIPARRRLLLIDACHSGEVEKDEVVVSQPTASTVAGVTSRGIKRAIATTGVPGSKPASLLVQELFVDLRQGSGANVLSSATGTQYAYEAKEWSNGVFTFALLEALKLRRADTNSDGRVSLDELRTYVPPRVGDLTGGRQTPTARALNPWYDIGL